MRGNLVIGWKCIFVFVPHTNTRSCSTRTEKPPSPHLPCMAGFPDRCLGPPLTLRVQYSIFRGKLSWRLTALVDDGDDEITRARVLLHSLVSRVDLHDCIKFNLDRRFDIRNRSHLLAMAQDQEIILYHYTFSPYARR